MKRITVSIDSEDIEEMIREKIAVAFPNMEIETTVFPYITEMQIRLKLKGLTEERQT